MNAREYIAVSRRLASEFHNIRGFISAGIAKRNDEIVIIAAISPQYVEGLPDNFGDMKVVVEDIGDARAATITTGPAMRKISTREP